MKTIRVVAAVIKDGDKIFATQRGYGNLKGGWEFPGGKIEEGETPQEALKREIMEELDTEIEVGELIDTIEYDYPEFHLAISFLNHQMFSWCCNYILTVRTINTFTKLGIPTKYLITFKYILIIRFSIYIFFANIFRLLFMISNKNKHIIFYSFHSIHYRRQIFFTIH